MTEQEQEREPDQLATSGPVTTGPIGPIVVQVDRKRRKKRYSRGLRDVQTSNRGFTRASRRLVRAAEKGMTRYVKESNNSARKRRDGALRDFGLNVGEAMAIGLREASIIPVDLARTFNTRGWRKSMRRSLKATARINRRLFRAR